MAKFCAWCGKPIGDDDVFCAWCGKRADGSDAPATPPAPSGNRAAKRSKNAYHAAAPQIMAQMAEAARRRKR